MLAKKAQIKITRQVAADRVVAKIVTINVLSTLKTTIAKTPHSMVRSCLFNVANLVMQVQVV